MNRKFEKQIKDDFTIITKTELIHPSQPDYLLRSVPIQGRECYLQPEQKPKHKESRTAHLTMQTESSRILAFLFILPIYRRRERQRIKKQNEEEKTPHEKDHCNTLGCLDGG
ncbi:MAG: hypothetical protein PHW41_04395 [Eubacteriales bacterium]|nr:hypothetical protein [Eubacteriales bacterium]